MARSVVKLSRSAAALCADHLGEAGLVDRDLAALSVSIFVGIDVDAGDVVAAVGETGAGHQSDVAGADDCNFHEGTNGGGGMREEPE